MHLTLPRHIVIMLWSSFKGAIFYAFGSLSSPVHPHAHYSQDPTHSNPVPYSAWPQTLAAGFAVLCIFIPTFMKLESTHNHVNRYV